MPIEKHQEINYNPWAVCITAGCGWSHPCNRNTRDRAKRHVKDHGHHVEINQENVAHWAPTGYDFKNADKTDEEIAAIDLDKVKWEFA